MPLPIAPRKVAFRARANRDTAKLVQLNIDDDTIRRLRVRTGKFPEPFFVPDETTLRTEVSKSPYYSVIGRAVGQLPNNTRAARLALYDRAEIAATAALLELKISDEQAAIERLAFERAIRKIEGDAAKKELPNELQEKHPQSFSSLLSFFRAKRAAFSSVRDRFRRRLPRQVGHLLSPMRMRST
jgi:hypothetical protein